MLKKITLTTGLCGVISSIALIVLSLQLISLNNERENLEKSNVKANNEISNLEQTNANLLDGLSETNKIIKLLENDISDLKASNASLSNEITEKDKSISELKKAQETNSERSESKIFNVSAYTSGFESTQKKKGEAGYGIMASGKTVYEGAISCPKEYDFGTKIQLDGLGTFICEDRGGAIVGNHLDIFFYSLEEAKKFGRKSIRGKIL